MAQVAESGALSSAERACVALVCPEPRWRRILALALQADGLLVSDWSVSGEAAAPEPHVVVADLDSLGWTAADAIGRLGDHTPMLLISVYPQQLESLTNGRPVVALQPPFRWRDLTRRVRCLLRARSTQQA